MRAPAVRISLSPPRVSGTITDWREFGARRYRSFHMLAVAQGFIGALTGPAIVLPLLLALGAHPALATALAVLPIIGTVIQRGVPAALDRSEGNLRGLIVAAAALGEPRGLLLALVVALAATGWLPGDLAIVLVALIVGILGSLGSIQYSLLQAWYQLILPDGERRLVAPKLGGISLGIGALVLVPVALTIDGLQSSVGLWAYVVPLAVSGVAGLAPIVILPRLPSPGRVRVPRRTAWRDADQAQLRRLGHVLTYALLAAGLSPFLSVYAMVVLGTGAGFAIGVSAVSSATLVASSVVASSHLRGGSASRLLRFSFLLRGVALFVGLTAHPANPLAPLIIVGVAVLMAIGDAAGQLAANERLVRLATGPAVIAFQSHYVLHNVGAYTIGALAGSLVMLAGGYAAFAVLFGAAGSVRLFAARATEVSRPQPAAAPLEPVTT